MDPPGAHSASKLDLYSIPVFLLEVIILIGLAFSAHYLHFQHKHEPYLTGFYCDDISLRHEFHESKLTEQFTRPDNELVVLSLLLVVPIVMIIFCELVNSMFGALKFRKIRALCKCCKLHSITRRTIRFSGAYLLGFLIVMISCDILASTTGKFKPYFAQECPNAFKSCQMQPGGGGGMNFISNNNNNNNNQQQPPATPASAIINNLAEMESSRLDSSQVVPDANLRPLSPPISSGNFAVTGATSDVSQPQPQAVSVKPQASRLTRTRRDTTGGGLLVDRRLLERQWILLDGANLKLVCDFSGDSIQTRKFEQLAMSWPSFPAALVTYACLFLAAYLSFVGTARPVRIITSVLVMVLLLLVVIFDVQLVREHFSHWEDSASGALLALVVVVFVLLVYLNKFKDAHYYENQKLTPYKLRARAMQNSGLGNGYSNEIALEQYSLDKVDEDEDDQSNGGPRAQNRNSVQAATGGGDNGGSVPNNDLAMRYFQIPRANYRGAPRPLSGSTNTNHM